MMARTTRAAGKGQRAEGNGHRPSRVPLGETPDEAFIRLAQQRVRATIRRVDQIGKLAPRRGHYTGEQVDEMLAAIEDALTRCRHRFAGEGGTQAEFEFSAPGPGPRH